MKWCYGLLICVFLNLFYTNSIAQKKSKKAKVQTEILPETTNVIVKDTTTKIEDEVIDGAQIQFENETYDFGKIIQGDIVRYQFKFKNTGNKDLIISDVKGSCGCTITQFPKNPIKPNQEATIDVSFNSAAKMGPQNKNLTVYTNAEPSLKILYIKGEVISPSTPTYLQNQIKN